MPQTTGDTKVVFWALRIVLIIWGVRYFFEGHWPLTILAIVGILPLIVSGQAMTDPATLRRARLGAIVGLFFMFFGPHGLLSRWYAPSPYELLVELIFS